MQKLSGVFITSIYDIVKVILFEPYGRNNNDHIICVVYNHVVLLDIIGRYYLHFLYKAYYMILLTVIEQNMRLNFISTVECLYQ